MFVRFNNRKPHEGRKNLDGIINIRIFSVWFGWLALIPFILEDSISF